MSECWVVDAGARNGTPNQALQQTAEARRLSQVRSPSSPRRC